MSGPKIPSLCIALVLASWGCGGGPAADCGSMVFVPEGWFEMGRDDTAEETDESPVHRVWVDGFSIDRCEVTVGQYREFVEATGHEPLPGWVSEYAPADGFPVVGVTWDDAAAFADWSGKALPTEAQWEKAARGTDGRDYPWGAEPLAEGRRFLWRLKSLPLLGRLSWVKDRARANYCDDNCPLFWSAEGVDDGYAFTAPVGTYEAGRSPYGAYDMVGNVWEWVRDWYHEDYYAMSPSRNPVADDSAALKVIRGGGWRDDHRFLRTTTRRGLPPDTSMDRVGFRLVTPMDSSNPN